MKYDIQYFIDKFEAIPENKWIKGTVYDTNSGRCCALGHCGVRETSPANSKWIQTEEANALENIYRYARDFSPIDEADNYTFWLINDRSSGGKYDGYSTKYGVIGWLKKEKERLDALNQT